jgi:hypothetical protein
VTRDQSLVNQLLVTGQITVEQAKFFEHSNVILQARRAGGSLQLSRSSCFRCDRMMLCSTAWSASSRRGDRRGGGRIDDPAEAARILIEMANGAGGSAKHQVIVAHVDGEGIAEAVAADALLRALAHRSRSAARAFGGRRTPTASAAAAADDGHRVVASPSASSPARKPTMELMSMVVVIGFILVASSPARRSIATACAVASPRAPFWGWPAAVLSDGHDTGARTNESTQVGFRLPPGHHVMPSLYANGAPPIADREAGRAGPDTRGQLHGAGSSR